MSILDNTDSEPGMSEEEQGVLDVPLPVIFTIMQTGTRANGGVESITQVIERVRRIRPIVVTQIETPVNRRWCDAGAEVHVWPIPYSMGSSFNQSTLKARLQRIQSLLQTNRRMYKLVQSTGCSVVHCNDSTALWHTALGARMGKAMVVFNIRGTKSPEEKYGWQWQVACRQITNYQLLLSEEMRDYFARRLSIPQEPGQDEIRIDYTYSIVDATKMYPVNPVEREKIRTCLGIGSDIFALGYVGIFNQNKAQLNFIEQIGLLLKASIPNAKVYFIGDFEPESNNYASSCLDAVKDLGLQDTICFIGYTSKVSDWYKALDVVVVASGREGLSRSMIESLACGTPVVSFDVCSAREILERHNCGLVVSQSDYTALFKQISYLAKHRIVCQTLGENGACVARELFDPVPVVQKYENLYFSLASKTQSKSLTGRLKT